MTNHSFMFSLRRWQREALDEWQSTRHGIVSVVTGAGKTKFAEACIANYLHAFPKGKIVILVPTIALLDQWYSSLVVDLDLSQDAIALYSGEHRPAQPSSINIAVVNTARHISPIVDPRSALLVVDECHRFATPKNAITLDSSYFATVGLSATPEREYDNGFERYLEPLLGPILFRYTYSQAFADGILSPLRLVNVEVGLNSHEHAAYQKLTQRLRILIDREHRGLDDEIVKTVLMRRARVVTNATMRVPAAVKLVENEPGSKCIVFHESVDSANRISRILHARGRRTGIYHTGIGPELRRNNLVLFRRGIYDTLVTCRALDEGLDVPDVGVAVIASSSASTRQRIQRVGRVLRRAKDKEYATVYTLYASDTEEGRLVAESQDLGQIVKVDWFKMETE